MQTNYPPKSVDLRTLEADDIAAICDVYGSQFLRACTPTPVNGLGNECGIPALESDANGGCTCTLPGPGPGEPRAWIPALLGLLGLARRSRPPGRP